MNQQEILTKLQDIITPYLEESFEIKMETDLLKDLALNSVDYVNIITEVEDFFQCLIDYKQMSKIRSVTDLIHNLMEAQNETNR